MLTDNSIVLIDDEPDVLEALGETFMLEGYPVFRERDPEAALRHCGMQFKGVVVSDLRMPKLDGFALLQRLQQIDPRIPLIIITGHGDVQKAVEAMRLGAFDFVEKPVDPKILLAAVSHALEVRRIVLECRAKAAHGTEKTIESIIVGRSRSIEELRMQVLTIAGADVDTLIHGETGTGKELVARCLHDFGPRSAAPFVALNCGALPAEIIASELFGHEAGAFTGAVKKRIGKIEHANGGTLFLDEIESLPLQLQTQFLRTLQERVIERLGSNESIPVDFRVVAATKIDLRQAADDGIFREDLLYRLNVAEVHIPPLRKRIDDVPVLFQYFVEHCAATRGREPPTISTSLLAQLASEPWRGNVRELRNRAERFALGLPFQQSASMETPAPRDTTLSDQLDGFERAVILRALREAKGNISATARSLGMPRKRLYLRMHKLGIDIGSKLDEMHGKSYP
jgi:two-component system, NtrC family, C4-dicarboxylate transport response regulator DctD